jgi:hypothetical protein
MNNGSTPGVVTPQTLSHGRDPDWQHARMRTRLNPALDRIKDKRTVRVGAPPTQPRRGDNYTGVTVASNNSVNSFSAHDTLTVGDQSYEIYRLDAVPGTEKLPYSPSAIWAAIGRRSTRWHRRTS